MAGRIGSVQRAQNGQTYGFVIFDAQDRACVYLGFSTWQDADRTAGGRGAEDHVANSKDAVGVKVRVR